MTHTTNTPANKPLVTFGEALLRFSTSQDELIDQARSLNFGFGGSELNIAINLTKMGHPSCWVSVLPTGEMGDFLLRSIQHHGVYTNHIQRRSGPIGWYFVESGRTPRPTRVLERQSSILAQCDPLDFDWSKILANSSGLHVSGITVALSDTLAIECSKAMATAKRLGLPVSFEFNYRSRLGSYEQIAKKIRPFAKHVDFWFASPKDLIEIFELKLKPPVNTAPFEEMVDELAQHFPTQTLLFSRREKNHYFVTGVQNQEIQESARYPIDVSDRIGAGDAMAGAFWWSYLEQKTFEESLNWAAAAGALMHTLTGDFFTGDLELINQVRENPNCLIKR